MISRQICSSVSISDDILPQNGPNLLILVEMGWGKDCLSMELGVCVGVEGGADPEKPKLINKQPNRHCLISI